MIVPIQIKVNTIRAKYPQVGIYDSTPAPRPAQLTRVRPEGNINTPPPPPWHHNLPPPAHPSHKLSKYNTGAYRQNKFLVVVWSLASAKSTIFVQLEQNFRSINET